MKNFHLSLFICLLILSLTSCTSKETSAIPSGDELPQALKQATATYPINDTLTLFNIHDTPGFILYNSVTKELTTLPISSNYVELEEIVNEDYFIFRATGEEIETVSRWFPYLIHCFRTGNEGSFMTIEEPIFFDLNERIQAGQEQTCSLAAAVFSFDGLSLLFGPSGSENAEQFYAGFADIPFTTTSYDDSSGRFIIYLEDCSLDTNFSIGDSAITDNPYIKSYEIEDAENGITIAVSLSEAAIGYYADKVINSYAVLKITFA